MYLRHVKIRKSGKTHTYWRLVRSVRRGAKVYQELVAYLGELDAEGRLRARDLAKRITGREDPGQLDLFEPPPDETVQVRLKEVRPERSRVFGDVWLAWVLWRSLRFEQLVSRLLPPGREDVPWPKIIATLVIARVCDPSSELHIAEQWFRKTALDDLLGIPEDKLNDDRLYRALDRLLPLKEDMERHVRNRLGELFEIDYEILLYDITSTYFEEEAKANPLARRGHSRDKRSDCKQVNIALVATKAGLPLAYEVFPGNTTDVTTVKQIVSNIETRFGRASRIWIMDRGMVSDKVLAWLRGESRSYIVGTPKSLLKKFEAQLLQERDWQAIRDGLEVKSCPSPDGMETFILCRSEARREKERATRERFAARIEEGLKRLARRLAHAKKKEDPSETGKQIGRLLERNRRAARLFEVHVHADPLQACGVGITWKRDEKHGAWARLSEGCYLLRAYGVAWTAEELWRAYIQLTDVEEAFRIHKTELKLRPVWHKTEERTLGHILVCFLAYVLWKTLEQWMQRAGLGKSPRKLLEELRQIQSTDVILPTTDGRELRLRCVPKPEKPLAILLDRLGLTLPHRLHAPECLAQM